MKALSQTQLQQLLSAVDSQSPFGLRDRLVVTFLLHTGLEPVELVGLNVDHVLEGSQVLERLHLAATLAGDGRARTVLLDQVARRTVRDILAFSKLNRWIVRPGCPLVRNDRGKRMTASQLGQLLDGLRYRAGIDVPGWQLAV